MTDDRLQVLASTWGYGSPVGAPATRDEERWLAQEILSLRAQLAALQQAAQLAVAGRLPRTMEER